MKYFTLLLLSILLSLASYAQDNLSALVPYPNHIEQQKGFFNVNPKTTLDYNNEDLEFSATYLKDIFKNHFNIELKEGAKANIRLRINNNLTNDEGYKIAIEKNQILIEGKTVAGVLYAVTTLDQLLIGDVFNTKQNRIKAITINDAPAFSYRALMLDPARHFLPVEDVKFYIDQMVKYKYNTLQIHLTDDQGWRMEIKSHPKLTSIGGFRKAGNETNGPDNGFYTHEQLKDIVEYAQKRNIEIIPEIDIPGHTAAILMAYPDLRCDFMQDSTFIFGRTENVMLSAVNPRVYQVLDDIIREVSEIFPSKTIHLGGDESAIESNWAKSEEHLELMKELGYTKPEQLMNVFFGHIFESVKKYDLHAILWCELDNIRMPASKYLFDYPENVTLVSWRYGLTPKCIELTHQSNNKLILAPGEYCYFDYPQYRNDLPEFLNWGMPTTTLKKTYEFDPTYNLPAESTNHIVGVMGTLWGEAIKDINRANYMTWPRGLALAEAGWTRMENREWESFKNRMYPNITELMKSGVSLRVPFEIATDK